MATHMSVTDFETEADLIAYAQAEPSAWMTCVCNGDGCDLCGGEGVYPAWVHDPEITGYPHERPDGG